jgi:hypothetical protein
MKQVGITRGFSFDPDLVFPLLSIEVLAKGISVTSTLFVMFDEVLGPFNKDSHFHFIDSRMLSVLGQ